MFASPDDKTLEYRYDSHILRVEAWGPSALRVRATPGAAFPDENWALTEPLPTPKEGEIEVKIGDPDAGASIRNGRVTARVTRRGKLTVVDTVAGRTLLEEFVRQRVDVTDPKASALRIAGREFRARPGAESWHLTARFEGTPDAPSGSDTDDEPPEKIFGMGQYQQPGLDLKGSDVELAQRNSQASVPFSVSSRGYGLLWNNPGVGRAVFGRNLTTFEAYSTRALDYWVVAGDTPAETVRAYAAVVGTPPEMPEYGLGFWQCKLRYQTQEEVLEVAREHKIKRGLPMDVIVVDYFHWPYEGEWKFDPRFWPDPDAMIAELKSMGIETMVSVWPTVDRRSENWEEMRERGLLIRQDRGWPNMMEGNADNGTCVHFDATNPEAQAYVWDKARRHYYDKGVRIFWLDEAEPEYAHYDFDNYRYHAGPDLMVGNLFPREYARGFWEGQRAAGQDRVVNLLRCCWAGSQKYGALLWSGDVASSWSSLRAQLAAGLSVGLAGIAWWTTDIGGFHGGDPRDPGFRELFVRWFQWGCFCPVFRLHGDREPKQPRLGDAPGSYCLSGAPNEVWSYGEEVYGICKAYLFLREKLRDYVRGLMQEAHEKGDPVIRTLFYEFPAERALWDVEDQYMFGSKYLVAPILKPGQRERQVVLPTGVKWQQLSTEGELIGDVLEGGKTITVAAPLAYTPVFQRQ